MNKKEITEKLNRSKEKLQLHLEKFNMLREQGKSKEALEELKTALNFANETLGYSSSVLRRIHNEFVGMSKVSKEKVLKKINNCVKSNKIQSNDPLLNIHIPEKKIIH